MWLMLLMLHIVFCIFVGVAIILVVALIKPTDVVQSHGCIIQNNFIPYMQSWYVVNEHWIATTISGAASQTSLSFYHGFTALVGG